jgi:hypothetical protein
MAWRGSFIPIAGALDGYASEVMQVYTFDAANVLTKITFHVTDPPVGGVVTIRVHDVAAANGEYEEITIADGELYATADVTMATDAGLWQEITVADGDAMNLSGEYEMQTGSGISQYFTTLALVKKDAEIAGTDSDRDTVLNSIIAGVTRQMQDWMGRDIVQGTATAEKIGGHYSDTIYTEHYPIISITSLTENDAALVEDTGFESLGPDLPSGKIVRISGTSPIAWFTGRRNISVTYDHGYANVPDSLVTACTALVVVKYFETLQSGRGWRGLSSKGVDPNASTTYDKEIWQRETIPAMAPFRKRAA